MVMRNPLKRSAQVSLFESEEGRRLASTTTFLDNTRLPIHRWFRFSAGFSGSWAEETIVKESRERPDFCVLDPFAGSATTLLAAEKAGVRSFGVEAHPFVSRVAEAKLDYRSDPAQFEWRAFAILEQAHRLNGELSKYPDLITRCFREGNLRDLDRLRRSWLEQEDSSAVSRLCWLALVSILRIASHVGTAPWQYVLPHKEKKIQVSSFQAYEAMIRLMAMDMRLAGGAPGPPATLLVGDARTCANVPDESVDLILTSPPYANNYDYADATRLEMSFMGEVSGWGDLHDKVRRHLVRSCSQHVPEKSIDLQKVLAAPELDSIRTEIVNVCSHLAQLRLTKGGKKTYHLLVACYFHDMGRVWTALRRVCKPGARVCFVIGDSAPYGVYVPVIDWLGRLALSAGFRSFEFVKTRDRNLKWKNRKHRVPLCEGQLWIEG